MNIKAINKIIIKEIKTDKPFYEIAAGFAHKKGTVLLLSGGDEDNARYNILAAEPWLEISSKGRSILLLEMGEKIEIEEDPLEYLKNLIERLSESYKEIEKDMCLPELPISTGLFGYLSYDLKDHIEKIPRTSVDDLGLPDLYMVFPGIMIVEDRKTDKIYGIVIEPESTEKGRTDLLIRLLENGLKSNYKPEKFSIPGIPLKSNFQRVEYENILKEIIEYIKNGDIYQVNMSQRFSTDFQGDSYSLFVELFKENPAPFFAYINCGNHQIVSTSPERFILQEGNRVEARPIKGTRPRGKTPEDDENLKQELMESLKDDAELSMIVDLLRNDIGKVCKGGSVKVLEHKTLTAYKNVYHLVSTIEGILERDKGSIDLLRAAFPGGSITGCPKIRAMEIIDEKEPFRRHIYTGSIGYIGLNGRMDLSIVIRTATITEGKLFFSVGGGIVYDSLPEDEYEETLHKAQTLMKVLSRHKADLSDRGERGKQTSYRENYCWHNGKFIPDSEAFIPVFSPGYQYGQGVFETLKVEKGGIEYLEEHQKRLEDGCRKVLGKNPVKLDWKEIIELLIRKNNLKQTVSAVKILISQGRSGLFGNLNTTVTCREYKTRPSIIENGGLRLGIYPHRRDNFLADYKTMNYLFYLKAGEWAKENGFDEAVILNADGSVSETNTGNIIIVEGRSIILPKSNHRLQGIMEAELLKNYKTKKYQIVRKQIFQEDLIKVGKNLAKNSQILVTNSLIGFVRVLSVAL